MITREIRFLKFENLMISDSQFNVVASDELFEQLTALFISSSDSSFDDDNSSVF